MKSHKNKKIKVYLQYPWKFPDSPYYKYLLQEHPKEIEYLNTNKQKGVITSKKFFWFSNFLKRNIRRFANILNLSIPNAHKSPEGDYDLIHCAHCLSKNKDTPWVADMEAFWQMNVGAGNKNSKKKIEKILLRENCKKILSWTQETNDELTKIFPGLKKKFGVLYPAIPGKKINKKKNNKKINLIFTGRYFYQKGGLHALEAIDKLTKEHENVEGIFNSEIPKDVKEKYSRNKKIKFYGLISQEKLFELYKRSDILVYPGYSDSFGFAYIEAMSFGVPIVTVDGFARKEIVEEGKTGFVLPKKNEINTREENLEIVNKLMEKTSILIKNKTLREKMSKNCINEIKNGKFSIKERNKKLKKIYKEALK